MRFSENQKIAIIVLAVCVLVSVFGLGGIGLARERGKAVKVFQEGDDPSLATRYSIDAFLNTAKESAQLMTNEAEVLKVNAQLIENVETPAKTIADASATLDSRYTAYVALKEAVEKLYNAAYDVAKAEGSFKDFKLAYDDFWGADDLIQRDPYHQVARSYNKLAGGFPGALVALITGQGQLNTFGG